MTRTLFPILCFTVVSVACTSHEAAGTEAIDAERPRPTHSTLYHTIAQQDSAMFAAFNAHDADRLATWFTSDLEFYHDKDGLAGFDTTMAHFRGLFERNKESGLRRVMIDGSLEVYPLGSFGALEVCAHRFCHMENGEEDCGTFKNVMVWRNDSAGWHVSRVISYDH